MTNFQAEHERIKAEAGRLAAASAKKVYFFVKSADGTQYLQAQLNCTTGEWSFWLAEKMGWTPCCPTIESAAQYAQAAEAKLGPLSIIPGTL